MKTNHYPSIAVQRELAQFNQVKPISKPKDHSILIIALVFGSIAGLVITAVVVFGTYIY